MSKLNVFRLRTSVILLKLKVDLSEGHVIII